MPKTIKIHLNPAQFVEREANFLETGELRASLFRYPSSVCAIRLRNGSGELIMLPFQGQQIWSAEIKGRKLTMRSMFDQPNPTTAFLHTFGGFFQHCGATAMGVPAPEDSHPLHGELPNAPYQSAYLEAGEDNNGAFIALGGVYRHTVAFQSNYSATPLVKIYAGSSIFHIQQTITNLKKKPMPLMYLAHINFKPVDGGKLLYTAPADSKHIRVRNLGPNQPELKPHFREFINELAVHPEKHMLLTPDLIFDPEVVLYVDYLPDEQGWAHGMQLHPDGNAAVIYFRPEQLKHGITWLCRTPDQDALGLEAATAEVAGYIAEKKKGNIILLPPEGVFRCDIRAGALPPEKARAEEELIQKLVAGQS